jgi:hypothetical protein
MLSLLSTPAHDHPSPQTNSFNGSNLSSTKISEVAEYENTVDSVGPVNFFFEYIQLCIDRVIWRS